MLLTGCLSEEAKQWVVATPDMDVDPPASYGDYKRDLQYSQAHMTCGGATSRSAVEFPSAQIQLAFYDPRCDAVAAKSSKWVEDDDKSRPYQITVRDTFKGKVLGLRMDDWLSLRNSDLFAKLAAAGSLKYSKFFAQPEGVPDGTTFRLGEWYVERRGKPGESGSYVEFRDPRVYGCPVGAQRPGVVSDPRCRP